MLIDAAAKLSKAMAKVFVVRCSKRVTSGGVCERADALSFNKFCLSCVKLCNEGRSVYKRAQMAA